MSPTYVPSFMPSYEPSENPSFEPSFMPSYEPSLTPTYEPSVSPSFGPSLSPTFVPSVTPSFKPSMTPTYEPSLTPSFEPSITPSIDPSFTPSVEPSVAPTYWPTETPSFLPSKTPTFGPTQKPRFEPSNNPTIIPTTPTYLPSIVPSFQPSIKLKNIVLSGPVSVYSNVTYYIIKKSPTTSYLFSFYLSALPKIRIVITPQLNGSQSELVQVRPPRFIYINNSTQMKASFYITGPSRLHGSYYIQLNIDGSSALEYSPPSAYLVSILPTLGTPPPPKLISAVFSNAGNGFTIFFDSPTDQAEITTTYWKCSFLFKFIQSSSTTCSWANSSAVMTTFGQNPLIVPNILITVLGGKLKVQCTAAACESSNATKTSSTILKQAYNPIIPKAVIFTSTSVTICDDIILDASSSSGSGGRPFASIVWSVLEDGVLSDNVTQFLNKYTSINDPLVIPKSIINGTKYVFTLSLTNFFDKTSETSVSVTISQDTLAPSVTIVGSSNVIIHAGDQLSLSAAAKLSSCVDQPVSLIYIWSLHPSINSTITLNKKMSVSKNPTQYILPAYSLSANMSYVIQLIVQTKSSKKMLLGQSATHVTAFVASSGLTAIIKGGTDFHPPSDQPFTLDATSSRDNDLPSFVPQNLKFAWTCSISSVANFGNDCGFQAPNVYSSSIDVSSIAQQSSKTITIPAGTLSLTDSYSLTCYIFSDDGRHASVTVSVTASPPGSVALSIASSPAYALETNSFAITGAINFKYDLVAEWNISLSGVSYAAKTTTQRQRQFSGSVAKGGVIFPISFPPSALPAGAHTHFD